jgi:hypothetical protein
VQTHDQRVGEAKFLKENLQFKRNTSIFVYKNG